MSENELSISQEAFDAVNSSAPDRGGYYPAIERSEEKPLTVRQAARETTKKRGTTTPPVDVIELRGSDGEKLDPRASFRQSDLREVGKALGEYRAKRDAALAEISTEASAEASEGSTAAEPTNQPVEQPAEPQPPEPDDPRTAETLKLQQARAQYEAGISALVQQLSAVAKERFADFRDINSEADLVALAAKDPQRYAQFAGLYAQHQAAVAEEQRLAAHRVQQQSAQWKQYSEAEDARFLDRHPELRNDPAAHAKLVNEVHDYLESRGITRAKANELYATQGWFRAAETQQMLHDAAKFHAAKKAASRVQAAPKPPPQRPGTARDRGDTYDQEVAAASKRLSMTGSLRDAVKLQAARRRAASR